MKQAPFEQNIIAMVWDCDKTLISSYMQEPLFRYYGVDGQKFWQEVNSLKKYYKEHNISINSDTSYLNHILSYVKAGIFKGLNNAKLKEFGLKLKFYPGLPHFFNEVKNLIEENPKYKAFDIRLEHYVVSTGFAETIKGSAIAPFVEGIYGCEFIENNLEYNFLAQFGIINTKELNNSCEISQIACALDNTSKTRYLFEINKGSNKYPETIDVNSTIAKESRRVPFENMIYIADGPSDVPAFSILNYNGGSTFAVYPKGDVKGMRQVDSLSRDRRVQMYGEADYNKATTSWLWLTEKARSIADKIVERKKTAIKNSAGAPPIHL